MNDKLVERIKADREAGTSPDCGSWAWFGGRDDLYLATQNRGRQYVMGFKRKGLNSAQPTFQVKGIMYGAIDNLTAYEVGDGLARGQKEANADKSVYRMDISGIDHPDARRIARVPDMEARILADAEALKAAGRLAVVALNTGCATQADAEQLRAYVNAYQKTRENKDE